MIIGSQKLPTSLEFRAQLLRKTTLLLALTARFVVWFEVSLLRRALVQKSSSPAFVGEEDCVTSPKNVCTGDLFEMGSQLLRS